jgi:CHAT domain-containing protein
LLLVAFHRALRQPGTAAEALRQAQLELMRDSNLMLQSPSAWAGFTLIGGLSYGGGSHDGHTQDALVGRP